MIVGRKSKLDFFRSLYIMYNIVFAICIVNDRKICFEFCRLSIPHFFNSLNSLKIVMCFSIPFRDFIPFNFPILCACLLLLLFFFSLLRFSQSFWANEYIWFCCFFSVFFCFFLYFIVLLLLLFPRVCFSITLKAYSKWERKKKTNRQPVFVSLFARKKSKQITYSMHVL